MQQQESSAALSDSGTYQLRFGLSNSTLNHGANGHVLGEVKKYMPVSHV